MKSSFTLYITLPDGGTLPVSVTRKRVKNLNLRLHKDGSVGLSIPPRCSEAYARAFLERQRVWLQTRLEEQERRGQLQTANELQANAPASPSAIIPLWGTAHRAGDLWGDARVASWTNAKLQKETQELYRREVKQALPPIAAKYERAMGHYASSWQVRSMTSRWGSCSPKKKSIRIALQLAAYPPACLDMVVAHELVHLMEANHGPRFHMLLDAYCPNNKAISKRLRKPPLG